MKEPLKRGQKASINSALVSLMLAVGKAVIGLMSGSLALIGSALDSFSDLVVMLASWFGLRISQRDPSKKFPYGYYKAESITALFVSLFILYAAASLLVQGYSRVLSVPEISMPAWAASMAILSIMGSAFLYRYLSRTGEETNSQLLLASSKERLVDVASSSAVLLAILLTYYRIPYAEGIVTMAISLLILRVGLVSVKDTVFSLMDVSPSKSLERKMSRAIRSVKGVEGIKDLKLRKSGPFIFGEVKVMVRKSANVERAHDIADKVEDHIKKGIPQVDHFTVHIEPYRASKRTLAVPVTKKLGMGSPVMPKFGRANYFAFLDIVKGKTMGVSFRKNPHKGKAMKAGLAAANFVVENGADATVTSELGEVSFHTLRDHLVEVYYFRGGTLKEAVDMFAGGRLKKLKGHTRNGG